MANEKQLAILKQGVEVWNEWRRQEQAVYIDLSHADLTRVNLSDADLRYADLSYAKLRKADLSRINLSDADLSDADLTDADLSDAELSGVDFSRADLSWGVLNGARLIRTRLKQANLSNCSIFGISVWQLDLEGANQFNLIITDGDEPIITVDNLEIAQFIYLLLHNEKLRDVIDTIGKKAVLILGRFTDERKAVLEAIREELRKRDYIPILFDFEKPESRDVTETVGLLAHMSRFVIADLTDAKSIPQELSHIVPDLPSVAVQPLILKDQREYGMFEHFQRYPWVLPIHEYTSQDQLIAELPEKVISPAEAKVIKLRPAK